MKYFTLEMSCNTQRIFITSSLFVLFIRKIYSFILSLSLTLTGVYKCYSHRSPLHIHSTSCELLKLKSFFYERDSCLCCYLSIQLESALLQSYPLQRGPITLIINHARSNIFKKRSSDFSDQKSRTNIK